MPRGPRSKLNALTQQRVVTAVRAGASFEIAASQGRISVRTHHDWMARGRAVLEATDDGDPDQVADEVDRRFAVYARAVTQARDAWELTQVREIERAGDGIPYVKTRQQLTKDGEVVTLEERGVEHDWRARAWLLERRNPKRWGKVTRTELSGPEGKPMEIASVEDLEAEAAKLVDELSARRERRVGSNGHGEVAEGAGGNGQTPAP